LEDNGTNSIHHVMDPFQANYGDTGLAMIERANLQRPLQFHRKFGEEVIPGLDRIQFAFVDASHLFDLTVAEFALLDKKLEIGGVIAFHDLWMPSLQKLVRYILSNRSYELVRDFDEPTTAPSSHRGALARVARFLANRIPGKERIFSPEFLRPWAELRINNLVFLRKMANDTRDWRFHAPF